jgi:hypothetical protein
MERMVGHLLDGGVDGDTHQGRRYRAASINGRRLLSVFAGVEGSIGVEVA